MSPIRATLVLLAMVAASGLFWLSLAPSAGAAEPYTIGTGGGMATDRSSHVAYTREDGTPVVHDVIRGTTSEIEGAKDCVPVAIGAGKVLLQCSDPSVYSDVEYRPARIASVRGGESREFFKLSRYLILDGIGKHWIRGEQACGGGCPPRSPWFINLRTGKIKIVDWARHPDRDLDSKNLAKVPSGRPFRVKVDSPETAECWNRKVLVTDSGRFLRLWRDSESSTVVGKSVGASYTCSYAVSFGWGHVEWIRKRRLNSVDIATGERTSRAVGPRSWLAPRILRTGSVVYDRSSGGAFGDTNRIRFFPRE